MVSNSDKDERTMSTGTKVGIGIGGGLAVGLLAFYILIKTARGGTNTKVTSR